MILRITCLLYVVVTKKIVELHGGTVSVISAGEGEGSTFTVRLPCVLAPDSELHLPANRDGYDDLASSALVHPYESLPPPTKDRRSVHCPQLLTEDPSAVPPAEETGIDTVVQQHNCTRRI